MFACCQLCYKKYLDEKEGKLIIYKEDYEKAVDENIKWHKSEGRKRDRFDYRPFEKACTCQCHIYGRNIRH